MRVPLAVTVTATTPGRFEAEAKARAAEWGLPFFERALKSPLQPLLDAHAEAFLVLGGDGWSLTDAESALQFSPGLAHLRIGRLRTQADQPDQLIQVSGLRAGDVVLDCTLGLGADALVCAHVVGPRGRVVGVEASRALALLVKSGLRGEGSGVATAAPHRSLRDHLSPGERGLEVVHSTAFDFLRTQPDRSADVVFFDPMFTRPKRSSKAFEVLRRYAVHQPIDAATLHEARRVARRHVVIKSGPGDKALRALGLKAEPRSRASTFWWAVVPPL